MTDACADAEVIDRLDAVIRGYDPDGVLAWRVDVEVSPEGYITRGHDVIYPPGSGVRSDGAGGEGHITTERIRLWDRPRSSYTRSSDSRPAQIVTTHYGRGLENGQWTEWVVSERTTDNPPEVVNSFCGYDVDRFTTFVYDAEERLDGVRVKKFTWHLPLYGGERDRWEFWVDSEGRLIKNIRTVLDESGTAHGSIDTVASGWNEPNVVTAPVMGGSKPSPAATPTLEPTHAPTPIPATAGLEPDPTTVTIDGSGWRQFTVRGTGLEQINLLVNVSAPGGPASTGAVELAFWGDAFDQPSLRDDVLHQQCNPRRRHLPRRRVPSGNGYHPA